ncbi:MAG: UPF0182 family protein [Chloroflexota bacterium]|nr:UPF0182 family protein [Chloroflexota bacterium]
MRATTAVFVLVVLALLLVPLGLSLWLDARWFGAQGLAPIFALRLQTQVGLGVSAAVLAGIFAGLNLAWAAWRLRRVASKEDRDSRGMATIVAAVPLVAICIGLGFGLAAFGQWQTWLGLQAQEPFGQTDPTFNQDIAFYVWTLPALATARGWLTGLTIVVLLAVGLVYALGLASIEPSINSSRPYPFIARERDLRRHPLLAPGVRHLAVLGAVFLALVAGSYWLNNWELVYSSRGFVYGASATDMHAIYPANTIMAGVALVLAALLLLVAIRPTTGASTGFLVTAAAVPILWIGTGFVLGELWPGLYEQVAVHPNQLAAEGSYIQNNIISTRRAMDLERIDVRDLTGDGTLDAGVLSRNQPALADVRITDWRPLMAAYNQLQRIRQYYEFSDIDVDRYPLRNGRQQVMLATRELDPTSLAQVARTWQNTHLVYTHGQAVVVSSVNQVTPQGLPQLLEQDIPATTDEPALAIDTPGVYFGMRPSDYAVVGTRLDEFDRPSDNATAEIRTRYAGGGGIPVGGGLERLATAAVIGDGNLLLSTDVNSDSQILLHRQVQERISHVAPFLRLDHDPYQVILNGRLLWVQDAYTWTNRYPDASLQGGINYLRNSVKVTVDDYDGSMRFYAVQPDEPILRVWMRLYPSLFLPVDQAPPGLVSHFRYPEDLLNTQAAVLATYHMTDPQTFYNREDLWSIAQETYGDRVQQMQTYYTTLRLPGESGTEFASILPFTPSGQNRNNMLAWMVARSDAPNYGQVVVYRFPQGKLVFGPQQIEARINQEPAISSQITLWNQQGSQVLRGNLLVIPLEDAVLYMEPLYIQAQSSPLPELKRIIVASTDSVVMSDRLDTALSALGQGRSGEVLTPAAVAANAQPSPAQPSGPGQAQAPAPASQSGTPADLAAAARDHLRAAEAAAGKGDWTTYGTEMTSVHQLLDQLASAAGH